MARRSITNPPPGTVLCCTEPTGKCLEDHCNGQNASHKESPEFMREEGESYGRKAREVKQNSIRTIPCLLPRTLGPSGFRERVQVAAGQSAPCPTRKSTA